MLKKDVAEPQLPAEQIARSEQTSTKPHISATRMMLLGTLAFILCVLITVAPLHRLAGTTLLLQLQIGMLLAQVGTWLPSSLALATRPRAAFISTNSVEFLLLMALAFGIYGFCAWFLQRHASQNENHPILRLIWLGAIAAGLIFVVTPTMLSHDIFVYAGYGRLMAAHQANPYFVTLTHFPQDPFNASDDWKAATSAYGPIWLVVCSLVGFVLGTQALWYIIVFRLFALAAHLVNTFLVTSTLRTMGKPSRTVLAGTLLYAWNPLALLESGMGGHNDTFMVTFVLLGILLAARAERRDRLTSPRGYLPAIIAFTLATLVKFTAAPLIVLFLLMLAYRALRPKFSVNTTGTIGTTGTTDTIDTIDTTQPRRTLLHWVQALKVTLIATGVSTVVGLIWYGPFWIGHSISEIVGSFSSPPSSRFSQNSIMRAMVNWNSAHTLPVHTWMHALVYLLSLHQLWSVVNFVTLAITLAIGAFWLWRSPTTTTLICSILLILGALLIVTPWFFSWYVVWLVGLAAVCFSSENNRIERALIVSALTFSASAFLTYLFRGYPPFGSWVGFTVLATIGPPLLVLLIFMLKRSYKHELATGLAQ